MNIALSQDTKRLVECIFSEEYRLAAVTVLESKCGSGLPLMSEANSESLERIRFAALKLSSGSLAQLEKAVTLANTDWRDLLVSAEFANSLTAHKLWFEAHLNA